MQVKWKSCPSVNRRGYSKYDTWKRAMLLYIVEGICGEPQNHNYTNNVSVDHNSYPDNYAEHYRASHV